MKGILTILVFSVVGLSLVGCGSGDSAKTEAPSEPPRTDGRPGNVPLDAQPGGATVPGGVPQGAPGGVPPGA